jgi:multiple sugar transport system permease protein/putative chitobiose transport system permease protein
MTSHVPEQQSRRSKFLKRLPLYLGVILISAVAIFPLLWAITASLSPNEQVFANTFPASWKAFVPTQFTLEAYEALFSERGFLRPIINTTVLGLITVFVGGLIAAMAGFAFATFDFRFKNLLFVVVLLTFMVPPEVTIIPLYSMVDGMGWVNSWQALLLPGLANALIVFLFRQFFADIASDLYDAGRVDGAGWFRIFFSIVLPISKPILIAASLVLFLSVWEQFLWPLVVAPRPEFRMIQVAISLSIGQYQVFWNQLMAGSMIAALIPILLILPFQKYYISGLAGTGSKEG